MPADLLLLAIVQAQDADAATQALTQAGLRVTRISSLGGFLRANNVTLLLGLTRADLPRALELLSKHCRERTTFINAAAEASSYHMGSIMPLEVRVGGATSFALPVERFARFGPQTEMFAAATQERNMKLVVAIMTQEQATPMLDVLTTAGYRATLISTTGGFWRKGNATLLIGVEAGQVDDVLKRIEQVCQSTSAKTSPANCGATVFVLNAEQFQHI